VKDGFPDRVAGRNRELKTNRTRTKSYHESERLLLLLRKVHGDLDGKVLKELVLEHACAGP